MFKKKLNETLRNTYWPCRLATAKYRALPDFMIVGAMKAGTTSLFKYLKYHPQLYPSCTKEVHFFDGGNSPGSDTYQNGEFWYRAHFPLLHTVGRGMSYEASPSYLFNPTVPERIFKLIPKAKLIILLRDPTERAISHYFHEVRKAREKLPIQVALEMEDQRFSKLSQNDHTSHTFVHCSYKHRGLYKKQIENYLKYFSKEQLLIIKSEDLFQNPIDTLKQILSYLQVDPHYKFQNLHPSNVSSNRSAVSAEVYEYLNNYFKLHNEELVSLLSLFK